MDSSACAYAQERVQNNITNVHETGSSHSRIFMSYKGFYHLRRYLMCQDVQLHYVIMIKRCFNKVKAGDEIPYETFLYILALLTLTIILKMNQDNECRR